MSNLQSLNQQQSFWDWANSFDEGNADPPGWNGWGQGPSHHENSTAPPPPPAEGRHDRSSSPPPVPHEREPHEHGHPGRGRYGSHSPGPHEHGHNGRHNHHNGPRGGHGGRGRGGPRGGRGRRGPPFGRGYTGGPWRAFGGPGNAGFDMSGLASWFQDIVGQDQGGAQKGNTNDNGTQDFTPLIDIFSTGEAYVIHASLPGAAKEDIAVTWDAASSTLVLTGVVHRPGDEQLLKALEVTERDVGAFERKIVLGTKEEPAKVDEDAISAKLEHGILRVEVPKLGQEEAFVEVKRVDIE